MKTRANYVRQYVKPITDEFGEPVKGKNRTVYVYMVTERDEEKREQIIEALTRSNNGKPVPMEEVIIGSNVEQHPLYFTTRLCPDQIILEVTPRVQRPDGGFSGGNVVIVNDVIAELERLRDNTEDTFAKQSLQQMITEKQIGLINARMKRNSEIVVPEQSQTQQTFTNDGEDESVANELENVGADKKTGRKTT